MELQNTLIRQIDTPPGAVWDGWSLSFPMLLLLYAPCSRFSSRIDAPKKGMVASDRIGLAFMCIGLSTATGSSNSLLLPFMPPKTVDMEHYPWKNAWLRASTIRQQKDLYGVTCKQAYNGDCVNAEITLLARTAGKKILLLSGKAAGSPDVSPPT